MKLISSLLKQFTFEIHSICISTQMHTCMHAYTHMCTYTHTHTHQRRKKMISLKCGYCHYFCKGSNMARSLRCWTQKFDGMNQCYFPKVPSWHLKIVWLCRHSQLKDMQMHIKILTSSSNTFFFFFDCKNHPGLNATSRCQEDLGVIIIMTHQEKSSTDLKVKSVPMSSIDSSSALDLGNSSL